ncbi:hypothetical protein DFH08DRAFT_1084696 [Mycena albidolilacea]|uniref:Uncharacterized protein n=1 Tax=Mycena albidolilacea TaxID=1033008 RepID=A0AAD7EHX4_9AGAR|nr:hypothetical protein DFH08DRAFT_1084696 [Mycena albidolilacea]
MQQERGLDPRPPHHFPCAFGVHARTHYLTLNLKGFRGRKTMQHGEGVWRQSVNDVFGVLPLTRTGGPYSLGTEDNKDIRRRPVVIFIASTRRIPTYRLYSLALHTWRIVFESLLPHI